MRTKIFKILFWLLLWFVTGAVVVGAVVRSKTFQKWVTVQAADYFAKELNTKVSIGGFDVNQLTFLNVDSIFIGDRYSDTAFYIGKVTVNLDRLTYDFEGKDADRLRLNYVKLDDVLVNFRKYNDTANWNYEFVINYFSPPKDPNDTTVGKSFILKVDKVDLSNAVFAFRNPDIGNVEPAQFNPNDFRFNIKHGSLNKFTLVNDSLNFITQNLAIQEKSGFEVTKLQTHAYIHNKGLAFTKLQILTPNSKVGDELHMTYKGWGDMSNFITQVYFDAHLAGTEINMQDIAYWAPGMKNLKQQVKLNGLVKGTIDNLKARNLNINTGEESYLAGDFSIRGLPNFNTSFIDVSLDKSHTTTTDIKAIAGLTTLPSGVAKMGRIDFTGSFTGFPQSFVAYGNFSTNLGSFTSDIKLDYAGSYEEATYSGFLKTKGFNMGKFANEPELLGNIALDAEVKGKGLTFESIDAEIEGVVNNIYFNNYTYKNIKVDGNYAGKLFNGAAKIDEDNVRLTFDGSIDFTGELPKLDFVSTIDKANLDKLNIDSIPSGITGKLYFDFEGDQLDNLNGVLSVADIEYRRKTKLLRLDTALLQSSYSDSIRKIELKSSIADADIEGHYNFSQIGDAMYNYAATLLPQIIKKDSSNADVEEDFVFNINLKRPYLLANFLFNNLSVDPFKAKGSINTYTNDISFNLATEQILYDQYTFSKVEVKTLTTKEGAQRLALKCGELYQGDSLYLENGVASLTFDSSNVLFDVTIPNTIARLSTHLRGRLLFTDTLYRLVFENSSITSAKRKWSISDKSFISYSPITEKYVLKGFKISSLNESITASGAISKDIKDTLRVDFDHFDIADVNYFTRPPKDQELGGLLNGNIVLFNLLEVPLFTSDLSAEHLSFGADTLGDLLLQAYNDRIFNLISIKGGFTHGLLEGSNIKGWVNFDSKAEQNLSVSFNLNNATTRFFEPFLVDVASNLKGYFTTTINIAGTFDKPVINGDARFSKPKFTIDYLQTTFTADTIVISINDDIIRADPFILYDQKGVPSNAYGYVKHNTFSDFEIDFRVEDMSNFLVLNTREEDNELYYGTGYMTGDFEISGPLDDLFMQIKGRTERGTTFNLKLADENSVGQYEFITFVSYDDEPEVKEPVDLSGIRLNLDLEVTPDANIKIIFDSQLGDIIEGTGNANLRMEINTLGDFKMFGNFEIEQGKYLFTALDFINKNFVIKKGGTITWTGDPLNAQIAITAAYPARTSTQPLIMGLVAEDELVNYRTPVPVEALMKLKGQLMKPDIKFGISIPDLTLLRGSDANTNVLLNTIRRVERDQEEVSRQVFSLLSLGTFATPIDNGFAAANADGASGSNPGLDVASNTVGNLLSNQITNWLSRYDPNWDIGIQVGQGGVNDRTEVILSASRRWLDDRLQLDVSADNTSQGNINVNYKITPNGDNQVRIFGRNTNNPIYNQNILSFGGGFYFRKEFENMSELRRRIFLRKNTPKDSSNNTLDSIPSSINSKKGMP